MQILGKPDPSDYAQASLRLVYRMTRTSHRMRAVQLAGQLDRPERGFSYATDAPLDMRMDPSADVSAAELVNEASERELQTIFRRYGEERYARQIARAIGRQRKERPLERTGELVELIRAAIPAPARFGEGHPAKRVFQALRIEVNQELVALSSFLAAACARLNARGRLAVISYHSLEDRIVKDAFDRAIAAIFRLTSASVRVTLPLPS